LAKLSIFNKYLQSQLAQNPRYWHCHPCPLLNTEKWLYCCVSVTDCDSCIREGLKDRIRMDWDQGEIHNKTVKLL
jgi:hypothetical protein